MGDNFVFPVSIHVSLYVVVELPRSGVNLDGNLGRRTVDLEGLVEAEVRCGEGYSFSPREESGEGLCVFWCILSGTFCPCHCQKMSNFPIEVMSWWTLTMYIWEIVNTLLDKASNLVFEILKHAKI